MPLKGLHMFVPSAAENANFVVFLVEFHVYVANVIPKSVHVATGVRTKLALQVSRPAAYFLVAKHWRARFVGVAA